MGDVKYVQGELSPRNTEIETIKSQLAEVTKERDQALRDWSADAIKKTKIIVKLEKERDELNNKIQWVIERLTPMETYSTVYGAIEYLKNGNKTNTPEPPDSSNKEVK